MNKHLRPAVAAIFLGAVAGSLISHFPGAPTLISSQQPTVLEKTPPWAEKGVAVHPLRKTKEAALKLWARLSAKSVPANTTGAPTLVLRESVIIVHGPGAGTSLEPGTPVALLSSQGPYLRVSHEQQVLTVPRSAIQFSPSGLRSTAAL